MGAVVRLENLRTPGERVNYLLSLVPQERIKSLRDEQVKRGEVLSITTIKQALAYGDGWQRAYVQLESVYATACEQRDESVRLLAAATEELQRLKGITG